MSGGVIEFLSFEVAPDDHGAWIDADDRIWTAFLRDQPGFVSKQIWVDRADPTVVHAAITWSDESLWKSIPDEDLARVDAEMGEWRRPFTERVFDVVSSS